MDERQTTIRLKPDIRERLDRYCEREDRSMSSAINVLLDAALPPTDTSTERSS